MHAKPAPTAVIADDERLMREQIVGRLKEAWPELLIVGEAGNGREAVAMVQSLEPDIVFLDINMPELDGIKAAQALAGQAHVVFVTAYDEYAISAFDHGAIDYLLKPVEPERVALACRRLRERLQQKPDPMNDLLEQLSQRLGSGGLKPREYLRWVQASVGATIRMIPTSDILFFRAEDKYTRVQTEGFEALIRKPIKEGKTVYKRGALYTFASTRHRREHVLPATTEKGHPEILGPDARLAGAGLHLLEQVIEAAADFEFFLATLQMH